MKAPSRFINKSKGEDLFKEIAGVERFESGLWKHVEQLCFDYFVSLAKEAGEKVQAEGRTVIDIADVSPSGQAATPTPESIFKQLYALPAADIAHFGKIVDGWVDKKKEEAR